LFDFQYEKEELLRNPKHYKVGLNNELFGKRVFTKWYASGFFYGTILFFLGFFGMRGALYRGAHVDNELINGQLVYFTVVIIANMKIFLSSHNLNGLTWFVCHASTLLFVLLFWAFNLIRSSDIYDQFQHVFRNAPAYFIIVLVLVGIASLDESIQMFKRLIAYFKSFEYYE
jgi:magnesium-transporting ATPase (P-type)